MNDYVYIFTIFDWIIINYYEQNVGNTIELKMANCYLSFMRDNHLLQELKKKIN